MNFEHRSTLTKSAALISVSVIISLVLLAAAEGLVRIRHYMRFGSLWGVDSTFTIDQDSKLRIPIPNSETGSIKIDSRGFRSPDIRVPKPEGTYRIAFLGASATYCAEVSSNEATWPSIVVNQLRNDFPKKTFDFVNAGIPGYGVNMTIKNLERRVAKLDPDMIVVYHATNDLSGNSFEMALAQGIVEARTEQELSWLADHSLLWYLVEKNLAVFANQRRADDLSRKIDLDVAAVTKPFKTDLERLIRKSKAVANDVVLITFSTQLRATQDEIRQREAAITSLYYMPYMTTAGLLSAFDAYNDAIREVSAAHDVFLIEAANEIPGRTDYFVDSVHFTDAGSRTMAAIVAPPIAEILAQ